MLGLAEAADVCARCVHAVQGASCSLAVSLQAYAGVQPYTLDFAENYEAPSTTAAKHADKFAANVHPASPTACCACCACSFVPTVQPRCRAVQPQKAGGRVPKLLRLLQLSKRAALPSDLATLQCVASCISAGSMTS